MPKKKTALTIEERLQQALVPAEEQPYEVPENWVWVRFGAIAEIVTGGTPSKKHPEYYGRNFPFYKPSDLDQGRLTYDASEYLSEEGKKVSRIIPKNSTAVCCIGSIGKCGYLMCEGTTNQQINSAIPKINSLCLYYYLCTENFVQNLLSMASATTIAIVNKSKMESCAFPLPPLSEQQRIVERIEELFAKLDEAKERLQEVAESFAVRKAALLHKAFTGELIGKQVTELVPLENLVDLIKIGPFGSSLHESDYIENGIPLVNPNHIVQQRIVPQSKISISDEKAEELSSYKLKENDIVLGRRGEMGRCAPISNREENWICGTGSMIIRLKKEYDAKLYSLILGSQATVTYLENSAVGSTLKNLNEKIVRKIPVPQFSSEEQHEIVRLIDELLARERAAQQAAEQALASIDLMKKSILARAFRGELGTNKASEASALELLRQVLAEN